MGGRRGSFLSSHRFLSEAVTGKVECVKALVAANATVDKEDEEGWTALMVAVKKWKTSCRENGPVICVRELYFQK